MCMLAGDQVASSNGGIWRGRIMKALEARAWPKQRHRAFISMKNTLVMVRHLAW